MTEQAVAEGEQCFKMMVGVVDILHEKVFEGNSPVCLFDIGE